MRDFSAQVRKSAAELAALLDENEEETVLKDACLQLCQLFGEGIQNDRIQAILEADVVPKLVGLLEPSRPRTVPISVQSAALQVLGNVACGDDRQTQVVIDSAALPCLRNLLSSTDRSIRKEVCWIVSNITESSHQVQDVLNADILPPLLKLLDNQDVACREDATWVLFNLSSNRDPRQISYLAEKNGVRALCNLLACSKELDVLWKGCGTVAAVALKGLRNILVCGQSESASEPSGYNRMAALVAEAHGVERIEALTTHASPDVRQRARLLLERMFGAEPTSVDLSPPIPPPSASLSSLTSPPPPPPLGHNGCSCSYQHHHHHTSHQYQQSPTYELSGSNGMGSMASALTGSGLSGSAGGRSHYDAGLPRHLHNDNELGHAAGSSDGSSTDSDPEDDDSDSDLIPPPPAPCNCVLCSDPTPLAERRPRGGKGGSAGTDDSDRSSRRGGANASDSRSGAAQNSGRPGGVSDSMGESELKMICSFCSGAGRLGDGRAGLAAKLGRAVRLGHPHCIAILLSKMTWSQRVAATEAPSLLHPGGRPPDGGVGNNLPAVILAAQLGKPECLALLLRRCMPDLDVTHGKKRLTALAWAAHKGYLRCCQLLVEHRAKPSTKCGDGVTALHLAASGGGHVAICKLLIDHNATVNSRSVKKQTPLCLAAQKGYVKIVQLLLENGADPNNEDEGKYTPLHLAASNGFVDCVELLLKDGAHVDATTRNGVTPLHYAVQGGHAATVLRLISAGAMVNCNRKPLLLIAADDGNLDVVKILLDAQAAIDCKANIKAVLDKEYEVHDFLTPLHLAASKNHSEVVQLLLRRGAAVDAVTTKSGWTALDFAVLNGYGACAVLLLEHGAAVSDTCKKVGRNKWTLVQYAAHLGAKDVVRLLIQRLKEQRERTKALQAASKSYSHALPPPPRLSVEGSGGSLDLARDNGMTGTPSEFPTLAPLSSISAGGDEKTSLQSTTLLTDSVGANQVRGFREPDTPVEASSTNGSASNSLHRYDPRSLDGDESGFGTGPGYAGGTTSLVASGASSGTLHSSTTPSSRRRVPKEDRQSTLRAREIKKRETEAAEARDRLDEAISQRSVSKLTEAIAHVSKLVLHLATAVGNDVTGGGALDYQCDMNGYGAYGDTNGQSAQHNVLQSTGSPSYVSPSSSPSSALTGTIAPLPMEVGLGNEVQKARKILAGLLAEERRAREERAREAADTKRENAELALGKAITATLEGGDSRALARSVNRAIRNVLDKQNACVIEAGRVAQLVSELESVWAKLNVAVGSRDLDSLQVVLPNARSALASIMDVGGEGAASRVFEGQEPSKYMCTAESLFTELLADRQSAEEKKRIAIDLERSASARLSQAMDSGNVVELESALQAASTVLLTKDSDLASTMESAKKVIAKRLRGERRKLRQACSSNDPERIEAVAAVAAKSGLRALAPDVATAEALALKLRDQATTVRDLETAIASADVSALADIRTRLNALGMFAESERARSELERLQRAARARTLLESALADARSSRDAFKAFLRVGSSVGDDSDAVSKLIWPDAQRLCDIASRSKKYGSSLSELCDTAFALANDFAALGRQALTVVSESNDARGIAAAIAGYEKSFVSVASAELYDSAAGSRALAGARKRLAEVQAMDQATVKAESAQVKVEYALATSRRSAARTRGSRGHGGTNKSQSTGSASASSDRAFNTQASSGSGHQQTNVSLRAESNSVASTNSSEYGDDESSDVDGVGNALVSEPGSLPRMSNDVTRANGSRRARPWNGARPGVDDAVPLDFLIDSPATAPDECSHYYLFKDGTTVYCARCGNLRNSSNPEWLSRVKRRGNNLPPDVVSSVSGALHGGLSAGIPSSAMNALSGGGAQISASHTGPDMSMLGAEPHDRDGGHHNRVQSATAMQQQHTAPTTHKLSALLSPGPAVNPPCSIPVPLQSNASVNVNTIAHLQQQQSGKGVPPQSHRGRTRAPSGLVSAFSGSHHGQGSSPSYSRTNTNPIRPQAVQPVDVSNGMPAGSVYGGSRNMQHFASVLAAQQQSTAGRGYRAPGTGLHPREGMSAQGRAHSRMNCPEHNTVAGGHPGSMPIGSSGPAAGDEYGGPTADLSLDFANEDFGFDIDQIVSLDDNPPPQRNGYY